MDWFRWHHGTVSDPKFMIIAKKSGQSVAAVIAVWAAILERASRSDLRGNIDGFDFESYDLHFGLDDGACELIVKAMEDKGLLECHAMSRNVTAWNKRQPKREDEGALERKRQQRERNKTEKETTEKQTVMEMSRNVTQCHAREDKILKELKDMPEEKHSPAKPLVLDIKKQEHNQRLTWFKNWFVWACQEVTGSRYAFSKADGCMLDQMLKAVGIGELVERSSYYLTLTDETRFPRGAPTIKGLNTMINQLAGKDGQTQARLEGLLPQSNISLKNFTPWRDSCQISTSGTSGQTVTQQATA